MFLIGWIEAGQVSWVREKIKMTKENGMLM